MRLCIICNNTTSVSHYLCDSCISAWCDSFIRKQIDSDQCIQTSEKLISLLNQIAITPTKDNCNKLDKILLNYNILQCIDYALLNLQIEHAVKNLLIEIFGELVLHTPWSKTNFYQLISYDQPLLLLDSVNHDFKNQLKTYRDELLNETKKLRHRKRKYEKYIANIKKLKTELVFIEFVSVGVFFGGFTLVITGMNLLWLIVLIIAYFIIFIVLKTTRYKGINLDLTYQPHIRYRIDELNVNSEYLKLIEDKANRLNKIIL